MPISGETCSCLSNLARISVTVPWSGRSHDGHHIGVALAPGRVRHLGDDGLDAARRRVEAVVEADGVEAVAEVAQVREQPNRAVRARSRCAPRTSSRTARRAARRDRRGGRRGETRRAPAGGPTTSRQPSKQRGQLVEVEVDHEERIAQLVLDRPEAAVADPALVAGSSSHSVTPNGSTRAQRADDAVLVEAPAPVGAAVVGARSQARDLAVLRAWAATPAGVKTGWA